MAEVDAGDGPVGPELAEEAAACLVPQQLVHALLMLSRPGEVEGRALAPAEGPGEMRHGELGVVPERVQVAALRGCVAFSGCEQAVLVDTDAAAGPGSVEVHHLLERRVERLPCELEVVAAARVELRNDHHPERGRGGP